MSRINNRQFIGMFMGKYDIERLQCFYDRPMIEDALLNDSQKEAIQSVLTEPIRVIQGPPGTGKTSVIVKIISHLLHVCEYPILVVASSNLAVDNIAEQMIENHSDGVLRIVAATKEVEYGLDHRVGPLCLHNKVYKCVLDHIRLLIDKLKHPTRHITAKEYKRAMTEQIFVSNKIMRQTKVFFTTSVAAGGIQFQKFGRIPVVIMDEATQSSEGTTMIPLSLPGVQKVVLVGDHKQLSSFSSIPELSVSLFENLVLNGNCKEPIMLATQYRMHSDISEFPSKRFYGGLLKNGLDWADRLHDGVCRHPIVFWDTKSLCLEKLAHSKFNGDDKRTYCNEGKARRVEIVLEHLVAVMRVEKSDIGVITPYRGQRDMISGVLVANDLLNPGKVPLQVQTNRDEFDESKLVTVHSVSDILIGSIDAFQGREKNFIIMSCVRANDENRIGFLSDERRLNVSITRAKYGMVIIGDSFCLKHGDNLWREYIEYLEGKGCMLQGGMFTYD